MDCAVDDLVTFFRNGFAAEKLTTKSPSSFPFLCFETLSYMIRAFHRIKAFACMNSRHEKEIAFTTESSSSSSSSFADKEEEIALLNNLQFENIWHELCTRVSMQRINRDNSINTSKEETTSSIIPSYSNSTTGHNVTKRSWQQMEQSTTSEEEETEEEESPPRGRELARADENSRDETKRTVKRRRTSRASLTDLPAGMKIC